MGRFWPLVSKHFFLPIFVSFEFKTPHLHHGKTMDPLEFHAKHNRLERKHKVVREKFIIIISASKSWGGSRE